MTSPEIPLVLNRDEGLRRCGGDQHLFQELVAVFLADLPRLTQLVNAAIAQQSARALRHAAHSLRGSASQIGALAVAQQAWLLEKLAKAGDLSDAPEHQARLTEHLHQLQQALSS